MYTFSFKTSSPIIARTIYIPSNAQRSWNRVLLISISFLVSAKLQS